MHERIYSIRSDGDTVEFVSWKLRAIGKRKGLGSLETAPFAQATGRRWNLRQHAGCFSILAK